MHLLISSRSAVVGAGASHRLHIPILVAYILGKRLDCRRNRAQICRHHPRQIRSTCWATWCCDRPISFEIGPILARFYPDAAQSRSEIAPNRSQVASGTGRVSVEFGQVRVNFG